jgi:acyl dehydratase
MVGGQRWAAGWGQPAPVFPCTRFDGLLINRGPWLTVTQDRVNTFADATDDHQWIHVDTERARTGPFGATIAHGYLTLGLVIPLWTQILQMEGVGVAVNYGLNRVRLPAPVPVGSQVRLHARVSAVEDVADAVQLTVDLTFEIQGGDKPALVAEALYRYR